MTQNYETHTHFLIKMLSTYTPPMAQHHQPHTHLLTTLTSFHRQLNSTSRFISSNICVCVTVFQLWPCTHSQCFILHHTQARNNYQVYIHTPSTAKANTHVIPFIVAQMWMWRNLHTSTKKLPSLDANTHSYTCIRFLFFQISSHLTQVVCKHILVCTHPLFFLPDIVTHHSSFEGNQGLLQDPKRMQSEFATYDWMNVRILCSCMCVQCICIYIRIHRHVHTWNPFCVHVCVYNICMNTHWWSCYPKCMCHAKNADWRSCVHAFWKVHELL
jgi:hypothetical protein